MDDTTGRLRDVLDAEVARVAASADDVLREGQARELSAGLADVSARLRRVRSEAVSEWLDGDDGRSWRGAALVFGLSSKTLRGLVGR